MSELGEILNVVSLNGVVSSQNANSLLNAYTSCTCSASIVIPIFFHGSHSIGRSGGGGAFGCSPLLIVPRR